MYTSAGFESQTAVACDALTWNFTENVTIPRRTEGTQDTEQRVPVQYHLVGTEKQRSV